VCAIEFFLERRFEMATGIKVPIKVITPKWKRDSDEARKLRKDRITAVIVLIIVAAFLGLVMWLAALSPPTDASYYFEHPMF
jgi:uncharacterized membrane protein